MTETSLPAERLYRRCDFGDFSFETTADLEEIDAIIGQERAVEATRFGIAMQRPGYNLFVLGPPGTGKHSLIHRLLERQAKTEQGGDDLCYVNNFAEPHKPRALRLPAGRAVGLRDAMNRMVDDLRVALPAAFESEDYRTRRQVIEEQFKETHEKAFGAVEEHARARGIALIRTPMGLALAPMVAGQVMTPEAFERLPAERQAELKRAMEELQKELEETLRKVPEWERKQREAIRKLNQEVTRFAVAHLIDEVRQAFGDLPAVLSYLDEVEADLIENAPELLAATARPMMTPEGIARLAEERNGMALRRYRVNVMVDRSGDQGAPVVYEDNPTYHALIGRIEHLARFGALTTDFTLIKAGAFHRANGGYLIIDARRLLSAGFAWEALKRVLRSREIRIETLESMLSVVSTVSLEPEPVSLDVKVVLIGEPVLYHLLCAYDPDFPELFKIAADFDDRMDRTPETTALFARLIATIGRREEMAPFARGAVARIVERASRLAGDAEKLTANLRSVLDLMAEAEQKAKAAGRDVVTEADVDAAIDAQIARSDRIYQRIGDEIARGTILIDTQGRTVGQVNGLSVFTIGGMSFGRPSRITARIRLGKGEVVDIEREVELGGPIHSKGVLILAGFLGGRFSGNRPLSLSASLVFEQSYGGVDGDSASLAETCALLSALAELPIDQGIAITGSINQHGQVQAIGGVNEKIEGFFDVCRRAGLTGRQGVLIPKANVPHLMLRRDVVRAAADGQFSVWPVETVDEAITLLTGVRAGEPDSDGAFPPDSVNGRVMARLNRLAESAAAFASAARERASS